MAQQHATSPRN